MKKINYSPLKYRMDILKFSKIKNKKILDIGTGTGYLAILAAKNFNCAVTTIDVSEVKIKIAKINAKKEKVIDKIIFKKATALKMPYAGNCFDAVIAYNALHHIRSQYKKVIAEMFRTADDKVIITELTKTGAKSFDEYLHPGKNHQKKMIDLKDIKKCLQQHSTDIKIFKQPLMTTFVCKKIINKK